MMVARTCLVHISAVQRAGTDYLSEGDKVTFDIVDNRGKPVAYNLSGEIREYEWQR